MRSFAILALVCGCSASSASAPSPDAGDVGDAAAPAAFATFVELAPRDVTLHGRAVRVGARARIFANVRYADGGPRGKPVFVAFNGFASEVVRAFGTGPTTVAEGGAVVANAASLTKLASVVYVDPRQAGYSYDLGAPSAADCSPDVFNEYVDAADVLLAVIALLEAHPELDGPVYWLGESYAGVRVQWILAYLRARWDLVPYVDDGVARAVAASKHASLRAGQILIQPWLAGGPTVQAVAAACTDASVVADVSASVGVPCGADACACATTASRSLYNYTYTDARQTTREHEASAAHVVVDRAAALLGVPLASIAGFADRARGFKCAPPDADTPSDAALQAVFGALPSGQAYFVPYSPLQPGKETTAATLDWRTTPLVGAAFVDNLRDVPAFVTDARRDLVVPTRALVPALGRVIDPARLAMTDALHVAYPDGERVVAIRAYPSAGHMVTMIEPDAFARDVAAWLAR